MAKGIFNSPVVGVVNSGAARLLDAPIVGPLVLHLAMAEIFGIVPEGGMQFDKLIDNHLSILFDGLSAPPSAKAWSST